MDNDQPANRPGPIAAAALAAAIAGQIAFEVFVAGIFLNECLA